MTAINETGQTSALAFVDKSLDTWSGAYNFCILVTYITKVAEAVFPSLKISPVTFGIKSLCEDCGHVTAIHFMKEDAKDLVDEASNTSYSTLKKTGKIYLAILGVASTVGSIFALACRVSLVVISAASQVMFGITFLAIDSLRMGSHFVADAKTYFTRNKKVEQLKLAPGNDLKIDYLEKKNEATLLKLARGAMYFSLVALAVLSSSVILQVGLALAIEGAYIVVDLTLQVQAENLKAMKESLKGGPKAPPAGASASSEQTPVAV